MHCVFHTLSRLRCNVVATLVVSMLAHHSTPALGSPLAPFDANGDNAPDTVLVTAPTEPGGAPGVSVRLSGASPSTVALSAAAGSSFGFDIAVVDPDGPGGLAYRVAVSEPRRMVEGAQRGAVWFFDAVTGQSLGSWTSPEPASLRVGLRVQFVADQDLDGQADLLVEGARLHDGVWQPRVLLVSGANQRLLRESTAGFAESLAAVRAGVALFSPADVNGDGTVDGLDLLDIATHVGQTVAPYESGDLNGDGHVNAEDIHLATDQFVRGVRVHSPERLWNDSARVAEFDQVWGQAYLGNPGTPFVAPSAPASPLPASTGAESSTESPQFVQLEGENEEGEPFHPPQLILSGPPATRSLNPWIGQYSCGEDLSQSCKLGSPDPANAWQAGIGWCLLEMQNCPSGPVGLNVGIPMPKATGTIQNLPGTQCVTEISQDGEHWFDVTGEDEALAGMPFVPANGGEFLMSTSIEGCVLVRIRCWNDTHDPNSPYRGCCACTQCAICSQGPEAPPCPIRIDILNPVDCTAYRYPDEEVASCQTPPESVCTVYRSSCDTVRLRAMAQPPGGFFSWTVNGYPYEYPGSPAEQAAAAQQNPNQIRLTPERLEETCQIVRVTYSLYEEGTLICEASRTIRIINDDLDCDDLTDDAELNVYGTDKNDSDTDDDGFCDGQEVLAGTNPLDHSSFPSGLASDIDGDGLADSKEEQTFLAAWPFGFPPQLATETVTSPVEFDTDHDGVQDLAELALGLDPVQRFLPPTPGVEANVWSPAGNSGTTRESDRFSAAYMAADRDQDLLFDEYERSVGMDPSDPDMDKDGIRDGLEIRDGTDPRASHRYESADTDGDGLSDYEEVNFYGTDPNNADTDKDSLPDGFEIRAGLNPHTARTYSLTASGSGFGGIGQYVPASVLDIYVDLDGDGLNSLHEYAYGTDPLSPDTDNDGVDDKTEIIQTTSPLDPTDADQGLPRDQVCVVRITIGPHTHDAGNCYEPHEPDYTHYTYDPIGSPVDGENVKADHNWSVAIGGGGSSGGPGFAVPVNLTTQNGQWGQIDVVLRKGECMPISLSYVGAVVANGTYPHYFLGAFPVADIGGLRCLACCCLAFDEPNQFPRASNFFGNNCDLRPSDLGTPRTGYVCLPDVDLDIDSDNSNGFVGGPDRDALEEFLEQPANAVHGGMKLVLVSRSDVDSDGIIDFADGFNGDGLNDAETASRDDRCESLQLVPVVVQIRGLPQSDAESLRVTLDYDEPAPLTAIQSSTAQFIGLDPSQSLIQTRHSTTGKLRVWRKPGSAPRLSSDFIEDAHPYTLEELGFGPQGGTHIWYVEAVAGSSSPLSIRLAVSGIACATPAVRVLPLDPLVPPSEPLIAGYNVIHCSGGQCLGTLGNDIIVGADGPGEEIYAFAGDDVILPSGGHDLVHTGPGSDSVFSWRGSKDIVVTPGEDLVYRHGAHLLAASPLTHHQTEPPEQTPEPQAVPTDGPAAPFQAGDVIKAYEWAFGVNDPFLAAFLHPDNKGEILVVPSTSSTRPSVLTLGTWDMDRLYIDESPGTTPPSGPMGDHGTVHKYVFKCEYSIGDPLSAAVALRQAILDRMRVRDFELYAFDTLTPAQQSDPTEFDRAYASWAEMRTAQLEKVKVVTQTLVELYVEVWLAPLGAAGEVISAVIGARDTARSVAVIAKEGFNLLSSLPGTVLNLVRDEDGGFLEDDAPPPAPPPDSGTDGDEPAAPPPITVPKIFARLRISGGVDAVLKTWDRTSDIAAVLIDTNRVSTFGFVARRGMEARPFLRADGRMVVILGRAQNAGDLANLHARSIGTYVKELAENGRVLSRPNMPERTYAYIAQNRSVRTCVANAKLGKRYEGLSRKQPDIVAVWVNPENADDWGVDMFEIPSGDQSLQSMDDKLLQIKNTFPPDIRDRVSFRSLPKGTEDSVLETGRLP